MKMWSPSPTSTRVKTVARSLNELLFWLYLWSSQRSRWSRRFSPIPTMPTPMTVAISRHPYTPMGMWPSPVAWMPYITFPITKNPCHTRTWRRKYCPMARMPVAIGPVPWNPLISFNSWWWFYHPSAIYPNIGSVCWRGKDQCPSSIYCDPCFTRWW
jgi:hypothetical protein